MTLPLWGTMQKAQDDSSTIDDEIDAKIAAHDADPTAHLASGASLAAHKAYEVIDHPAGSVVGDKFVRQRTLQSNFTSLDALSVYHNASPYLGVVRVYTDATSGYVSQVAGYPNYWTPIVWTKAMYWRTVAELSSVSAVEALLGVGCDDLGDGYSGFGFKIVDNALYAYHAEDTGSGAVFTTSAITGYTLTDWHMYEVVYDPDAGTLTFFVDGTQEAQFSSSLPTTDDDNAMLLQVKTTEAVAKTLYASDFFYQTEF